MEGLMAIAGAVLGGLFLAGGFLAGWYARDRVRGESVSVPFRDPGLGESVTLDPYNIPDADE